MSRAVSRAGSTSELEMKSALRKGDYKTLNLYFQYSLGGTTLGASTLLTAYFE